MIKCSECGREISDQAKSCPGCGAITYAGRRDEEQKVQNQITDVTTIILAIFLIVGAVVLFLGMKDLISDLSDGWYNYQSPLTKHEQAVIYKIICGVACIVAYILGMIRLRKNIDDYEKKNKTEYKSMNLSGGDTSEIWICPNCNAKNKQELYSCDKCGYRRGYRRR